VAATVFVSDTYDGKLQRFVGTGRLGTSSQDEDQGALFELHEGATLKNVVIGSPAADGVHCLGSCTLENVWWEDVGEDAATFRGTSSSARSRVHCGGARNAADKIFQHNGAGTLIIESFDAENFGKLYRSCGNCMVQRQRHVVFNGITAYAGGTLAGINANYGDTARFLNVAVYGNPTICQLYTGNDTGAEPSKTGSGADGEHCFYSEADIEER
jgi:hypothetical protein